MKFFPVLFGVTFFVSLYSNSPCPYYRCSLDSPEEEYSALCNLDDSTNIVLALIQDKNFQEKFAEEYPYQYELMLKNLSPAEIAFEIEVCNSYLPAVLIFHETHKSSSWDKVLTDLAQVFKNEIKFILIDTQELLRLTEEFDVQTFPTVVLIYNRTEFGRFENVTDKQSLCEHLYDFLNTVHQIEQNRYQ